MIPAQPLGTSVLLAIWIIVSFWDVSLVLFSIFGGLCFETIFLSNDWSYGLARSS